MSKRILNILVVGMLLALPVMAQAAAKIAVVDLRKVLEKAPQQKIAAQRLQAEFSRRNKELLELRKKLRKLEVQRSRDRITMSTAQLLSLDKRIRNLRRVIRRAQEDFREDANIRKNEELRKLHKLVIRTIHEVAKKRKLDIVLSDAVYASNSIDITEDVLRTLRAKAAAKTGKKK